MTESTPENDINGEGKSGLSEGEWEKEWERLKIIRNRVLGLLSDTTQGAEYLLRDVPAYVESLFEAGIDRDAQRRHIAWHVLFGSTPRFEIVKNVDFPGGLSVEEFFEAERAKFSKK